jgi:hypothetical protein
MSSPEQGASEQAGDSLKRADVSTTGEAIPQADGQAEHCPALPGQGGRQDSGAEALAELRRQAVLEERQRCREILGSPEVDGRRELAYALLASDLTAEQVIAALRAAPVERPKDDFSLFMSSLGASE